MTLFIFYILALVLVASAVMVIAARNPVHSVLFLILCFFNSAGLFVLIGAEFLAMVLVVVYVGAVAVLFMFVVMMLDINFVEMREGFLHYLPVGAVVGLILAVELILVGGSWALSSGRVASGGAASGEAAQAVGAAGAGELTNTEALGNLLYTEHFMLFQLAGVVLLVAILGAISLTLRSREGVRRQDIGVQVHRDRKAAVELKDVKPGAGI